MLDGKVHGKDLYGDKAPEGTNYFDNKGIIPPTGSLDKPAEKNSTAPTPDGGTLPSGIKPGGGMNK